jgi:hypothetical protein
LVRATYTADPSGSTTAERGWSPTVMADPTTARVPVSTTQTVPLVRLITYARARTGLIEIHSGDWKHGSSTTPTTVCWRC